MKILQIILCSAIFTIAACKKNENLVYQKEENSLNIWLSNGSSILDSMTYNFSYKNPGEDSILFNYRILGYPSPVDRTFELEASGSGLEDFIFKYGTYTIKAGQYQGEFPIYITKPDNYEKFKNVAGKVTFKLKETSVFKSGISELSKIDIILKNNVSKPDSWDSKSEYWEQPLNIYFGAYSDTKYDFMIKTLKAHSFIVYSVTFRNPNPNPNNPYMINSTTAELYKRKCIAALEEYESINGPLIDENENIVRF